MSGFDYNVFGRLRRSCSQTQLDPGGTRSRKSINR